MKATRANSRSLVGRTITAVDFRQFPTGRGRKQTTDPVITLDNGRRVWFMVAETEISEYGIEIFISEARRKENNKCIT